MFLCEGARVIDNKKSLFSFSGYFNLSLESIASGLGGLRLLPGAKTLMSSWVVER